jgi:Tfp pilus assembly protein PilV
LSVANWKSAKAKSRPKRREQKWKVERSCHLEAQREICNIKTDCRMLVNDFWFQKESANSKGNKPQGGEIT